MRPPSSEDGKRTRATASPHEMARIWFDSIRYVASEYFPSETASQSDVVLKCSTANGARDAPQLPPDLNKPDSSLAN